MALTLMFLKTNSTSAANGLVTPDTLYHLEAIRPDFLLLRVRNSYILLICYIILTVYVIVIQVLGHSLIMWDSVKPTTEWVQQHFPKVSLYVYACARNIFIHL